ncbi:hypothetical protein GZ77_01320 [Endozoicomonas montiporae]|uniref:Uncharacterized protein n=2 Tax=Endozoicomonas montiporae TaxID=1027273 RepID=A0A081NA51_9GAMM|nr:hypothetical protein [Endozoicomonas montiporae]AMO56996.1 hypothetical protein EZMO1_2957 [Endozoicomonas montiporae CL-33]KEQ15324.1 hypothetical protein GZ77_01320 [Endozoicomonas montiporae]
MSTLERWLKAVGSLWIPEEWHNSTGGTSKFEHFTRTLRSHVGREMQKWNLKRKYRFNLDDPNVKRWKQ